MADCGASGSAIDRVVRNTAAGLVGGGNQNNAAALTASIDLTRKALGSLVGDATLRGNAINGAASMMPAAPPTTMGNFGGNYTDPNTIIGTNGTSNTNISTLSTVPQISPTYSTSKNEVISTITSRMGQPPQAIINHSQMPMSMNMSHRMNVRPDGAQFMHIQMQQQQQQQFQIQMQMQHQMQMQNQIYQHQQQMILADRQKQVSSMNEQQSYNPKVSITNTQSKQENTVTNNQHVEQEEWHQHLEQDFESYMQTQKVDDTVSTTDMNHLHDTWGHEGIVEGAGIDELSEAWKQAESEIENEYKYQNHNYNTLDDDDIQHNYYNETTFDQIDNNLQSFMPTHLQTDENGEPIYHFRELDASVTNDNTDTNVQPIDIDFMAEGMQYFQKGDLSKAIPCFQSELKNNDLNNSQAWLMLGRCHAENDEDGRAIACLERAVERDPYNTSALMALGVSHVNELNYERALKCLNDWVTHNPNYAGLDDLEGHIQISDNVDNVSSLTNLKHLLQRVVKYDASNTNTVTNNQISAADALEALGVVCNVSKEYTEAVEHLENATRLKPDDHTLWNKLGATLANGERSKEALPAYQRALQLKPRYARAWLNVAISHSNLKHYEEAARCYLQTLALNPNADHVWGYLRIALTAGERWDLLPAAANRNIEEFRDHFDFVKITS